jgi:biotin transport system substrate-specific component
MASRRASAVIRPALVAALVAVGALITVPLGPVPVTLQVLMVAVAALVLSPAEAFAAMGVYVGLGALGLPVFSGGASGIGVLLGPTGGFIAGFVVAAPLGAAVRRATMRLLPAWSLAGDLMAMAVLIAVTYLCGLARFAAVTGVGVAEAFPVAVAPFVAPDILKAAVALAAARGVRAAGLGDAPCRPIGPPGAG